MNNTYSPGFLYGNYRTAALAAAEFAEVVTKEAMAWFLNDPDARQPCGWKFQRNEDRGVLIIEKNVQYGDRAWLAWVVFSDAKFATRKRCELNFPPKSVEEWTAWQGDELSLASGTAD